jgi:2,4-dienoyl-CoA reductase-like NADH-dependent reductase (Old Yellow Enzyme family)
MITADSFLSTIEQFLDRHKMSASAFGRAAVGDPNFVGDLRAGRAPNLRLVERVNSYIAAQEPAEAPQ